MVSDVFSRVPKGQDFIQLRETNSKEQELMVLFPAAETFELLAIDLLVHLKKATWEKTFFLVINDRSTKMMRCIPLRNTAAATMTASLLEYEVWACGARSIFLPEKENNSLSSSLTPYAEYRAPDTIPPGPTIRRQTGKPDGSVEQLCSDFYNT